MKRTLILAAVAMLLSIPNPAANAQILFQDNFQSDIAGTNPSTVDDWDPGLSNIGGSWNIQEGTTVSGGNSMIYGVQVYNAITPDSQTPIQTAGANNYLRIYRGGSIAFTGKPFATGWNTASTLNRVVQLDMMVWQEHISPGQDANGQGYMNVQFGSAAPSGNPQVAAWNNSLSVWTALSDGTGGSANLPDNQWLPVRITANLSSTDTQEGLLPQTYSVIVNNGTPLIAGFATSQNTVQSILLAWGGVNEHFDFIDDVVIQMIPEPSTFTLLTVGLLCCVWRKRK